MSLSTCDHCGGDIPLGPNASNRCETCGEHVFGDSLCIPETESEEAIKTRLRERVEATLKDVFLDGLKKGEAAERERSLALIDQRDAYHDWADKLAQAIAAHTGDEIGEHSSANNPWANALALIDGQRCR